MYKPDRSLNVCTWYLSLDAWLPTDTITLKVLIAWSCVHSAYGFIASDVIHLWEDYMAMFVCELVLGSLCMQRCTQASVLNFTLPFASVWVESPHINFDTTIRN